MDPPERRARLEQLPVTITPSVTDPAVARKWLAAVRGTAIDGVVVKPIDLTYQPGKRAMVKVKPCCSGCGTATAGCATSAWRRRSRRPGAGQLIDELAGHLGPLEGHPWARGFDISRRPLGRLRGAAGRWTPDLELDRVPLRIELVAEVAYGQVDVPRSPLSAARARFRHPARFLRWRPDRDPASCSIHQLD